jgi:ribosomal protein S2
MDSVEFCSQGRRLLASTNTNQTHQVVVQFAQTVGGYLAHARWLPFCKVNSVSHKREILQLCQSYALPQLQFYIVIYP